MNGVCLCACIEWVNYGLTDYLIGGIHGGINSLKL